MTPERGKGPVRPDPLGKRLPEAWSPDLNPERPRGQDDAVRVHGLRHVALILADLIARAS
jgi:hypothetical protein